MKVLFFDFFRTLVTHKTREELSFEQTLKCLNYSVPMTREEFLFNWESSYQEVKRNFSGGREFSMTEWIDVFRARYCKKLETEVFLTTYMNEWNSGVGYIEGLNSLLARLSKKWHLGIISNTHYSPMIYSHLRDSGMGEYVKQVFTSVEVGYKKPDARIFEVALDAFGVLPSEALHIGDNFTEDILGAKGAGIKAIHIAGASQSDAEFQVRNILAIEELLGSGAL